MPEQTSGLAPQWCSQIEPPADETTRATPKPKETAPETHASGSHAAPRRSAEAATHPGFAMHEVALRLALANGLGPSVAKGAGVEWGIGARPYLPFLRLAASWSESGSAPANHEDGAHFPSDRWQARWMFGLDHHRRTTMHGCRLRGGRARTLHRSRFTGRSGTVNGSSFAMLWASGVGSLHLRTAGARVFPMSRPSCASRGFGASSSPCLRISLSTDPPVSLGATFSSG